MAKSIGNSSLQKFTESIPKKEADAIGRALYSLFRFLFLNIGGHTFRKMESREDVEGNKAAPIFVLEPMRGHTTVGSGATPPDPHSSDQDVSLLNTDNSTCEIHHFAVPLLDTTLHDPGRIITCVQQDQNFFEFCRPKRPVGTQTHEVM